MVRNWEIIRRVLTMLEAAETPNTVLNAKDVPGFPEQEVAYNMRLLKEHRYIEANFAESSDGDGLILAAWAFRLTNSGHDLLDAIRSDTVWSKVKDTFKSKGIDMTFDLVTGVAKRVAESILLS